jgi:hypothetical protein
MSGDVFMRIEDHLGGNPPHTNSGYTKPEFFRLPKPGKRDPHFDLSRTAYYELEAAGAIRFIRMKKPGNTRGRVLISFDDVKNYLERLRSRG